MGAAGGFLFAGLDYGGTWKPMQGLAGMLVQRGHEVTVIGASRMRRGAEAAGCTFVTLSDIFDDPPGYVLEDDWDSYDAKISSLELAIELSRAVERTHPAVLVADCLLLSALSEAQRLELPSAAVMHFLVLEMIRDAPEDWDPDVVRVNLTRASRGLPPLALGTGLFELWDRADLSLHLPPPRWVGDDLPANARLVGPIANEPARGDGWDLPWTPDDGTPMIVISLSSTYLRQETALERLAEAATELDAHTVLSLAGSVPHEALALPEQVVVRDWVNFPALLPHTDLLVTHAGQATVSSGLSHGVPLLLHPLSRDQFRVARHVVEDGCGLQVSDETPVDDIRAAMARLLDDGRYRAAAGMMARELGALGNGRIAIEELESLHTRSLSSRD